MIGAVELLLTPDTVHALRAHRNDFGINDAYGSAIDARDDDITSLYVEPEMAANWVEHWFPGVDMSGYVERGAKAYLDYPAFCSDPLLKDFVDVVLKIYRLTA